MTLLLASASPQPSTSVRLRPSWAQSCRAYGKSRKNVTFSTCPENVVMSFCVAGVALCDISTCFTTRPKSFCVAGAILSLHFQKMCCIFRGRRSTLDTSDVILRGKRSILDVSCCVFFANRIVSAARSGDRVQIPWQAWHFVTCHENRRKLRTKHRF